MCRSSSEKKKPAAKGKTAAHNVTTTILGREHGELQGSPSELIFKERSNLENWILVP
jgi:hypothetical protein